MLFFILLGFPATQSKQLLSATIETFLSNTNMFGYYGSENSLGYIPGNISSDYSIISDINIRDSRPSTSGKGISNNSSIIDNRIAQSLEYVDRLAMFKNCLLPTCQLDNFHYYLYFIYRNSGAFSPNPKKSHCIPYLLYESHKIDKPQFALSKNKTDLKGKIYFGGIPDEIITQSKSNITIPILGKGNATRNNWGFNIDMILLGNGGEYKEKIGGYLYTNTKNIRVPKKIFKFGVENYFKKYIRNKWCENIGNKTLYCGCIYGKEFASITGVIGGKGIVLNPEDFFIYSKITCISDFELNEDEDEEMIVFGYDFIFLFFTLFDYETKSMMLISSIENKFVDMVDSNNESYIKGLFGFGLFVNSLGIILSGSVKKKIIDR